MLAGRHLRRAFAVAAVGWAVALPVAAWAASRSHDSQAPHVLALAVYGLASFLCHQMPERSFHLWTVPLPVCARCSGIYLGGALAAMASSVVAGLRRRANRPPPSAPRRSLRTLLIVLSLPTAATLAFEWTTGQTPDNWIRALAGFPLGAAVGWVVMAGARRESHEVN